MMLVAAMIFLNFLIKSPVWSSLRAFNIIGREQHLLPKSLMTVDYTTLASTAGDQTFLYPSA